MRAVSHESGVNGERGPRATRRSGLFQDLPPRMSLDTLNAMADDAFDIEYIAHLARMELNPEEREKLAKELAPIIGYVKKLQELDVSKVEPTAHAVPLVNVTRPDEVASSLPHEEALRNAPAQANRLFMTPKIVE